MYICWFLNCHVGVVSLFSFMLLDWLSKKMKPHDEQFSIYIKTQFYKSKYYINFHKSNLDIISSLNNAYLGFRNKIKNKRNSILNFNSCSIFNAAMKYCLQISYFVVYKYSSRKSSSIVRWKRIFVIYLLYKE